MASVIATAVDRSISCGKEQRGVSLTIAKIGEVRRRQQETFARYRLMDESCLVSCNEQTHASRGDVRS